MMTLDELVALVQSYWAEPKRSPLLEAARVGALVCRIVAELPADRWEQLTARLQAIRPKPLRFYGYHTPFHRMAAMIDRRDFLDIDAPPEPDAGQQYRQRAQPHTRPGREGERRFTA